MKTYNNFIAEAFCTISNRENLEEALPPTLIREWAQVIPVAWKLASLGLSAYSGYSAFKNMQKGKYGQAARDALATVPGGRAYKVARGLGLGKNLSKGLSALQSIGRWNMTGHTPNAREKAVDKVIDTGSKVVGGLTGNKSKTTTPGQSTQTKSNTTTSGQSTQTKPSNVISAINTAGNKQKVTVGRKYAATLGGKAGNVTYDASGKRTWKELEKTKSASTSPAPKVQTAPAPKPTTVVKKPVPSAKAAWLHKTRNSPAARSGAFADNQRWSLQQKHRAWKARRK